MPTIAKEHGQITNTSSEWRWTGDSWDRRSAVRLDLEYSLRLRRAGVSRDIEIQTKNVSSSGFYFQSAAPFRPQERVEYEMIMPWNPAKDTRASGGAVPEQMVLRGMARIVRVDPARAGAPSGFACRLEGDYTISRRDEATSPMMQTLAVTAEAC